MTPIEQQTFQDGFRLGLLRTRTQPASSATRLHAILYDGGRAVDELARTCPGLPGAEEVLALRRFLARLAAPPHVLVGFGPGWRERLDEALAEHLPAYRILDLRRAAIRLVDNLPPSADSEALARAYGISHLDGDDGGADDVWVQDLLWAVLATAGRGNLDWPALLDCHDPDRDRVNFERYGFDETTLRTAPLDPGVYVMRDRAGNVLYVGKAANLQNRLQDYFRASPDIPAKLETLRDHIFDLQLQTVGSELEAILLEQRWIRNLQPTVNIQRRVAEGAGRYAGPPGPVLMLLPSVRTGCLELFGFAPDRPGLQLRFRPTRPARGSLTAALAVLHGRRHACPRRPNLTDWGSAGAELMNRYFGRSRNRVAWLEPRDEASSVETVVTAAHSVLAEPRDAVEFRD